MTDGTRASFWASVHLNEQTTVCKHTVILFISFLLIAVESVHLTCVFCEQPLPKPLQKIKHAKHYMLTFHPLLYRKEEKKKLLLLRHWHFVGSTMITANKQVCVCVCVCTRTFWWKTDDHRHAVKHNAPLNTSQLLNKSVSANTATLPHAHAKLWLKLTNAWLKL